MLLEYKNFINSDVIIEVLEGPYWDYVLNEEFDYYDRNKGIRLTDEYIKKLENIEKIVNKKLSEINPFEGKTLNEKTNQIRKINYTLETTEHWFVKFFRKEFEDSRFINPDYYDGIDIIYNNIDEITKKIDKCEILNDSRVLIKSKNIPQYNIIVLFKKINPKTYNIVMQTQMKGKDYNDSKVNKVIKLYPYPK